MQFTFKKQILTYAFVLLISLSNIFSLQLNKYTFIINYRPLNSKFGLNSEASLMPKYSGEHRREHSRSPKRQHQLLKKTMKSIKEEYDKKTDTSTKEQRKLETESWKVVLYNDDIHSFTYVTESISKCVPQLALAKAHLITLEAHKTGQAEVIRTWKDKAENYCRELQKFGLTVCTINEVKNPISS